MRNTRRAMVAAVALLLLVTACGDDGDNGGNGADANGDDGLEELGIEGGDSETAGDDELDVGDADLLLLGWSSSPAENESLESILADWPGGDAALTLSSDFEATLRASLAAGDPADVFYVDSSRFQDLMGESLLASIGDGLEDPDDFYDSLRETFTYDGEFICPPKDFSILGLQYNVAMLEEAGVEPPTTWEELATAAEALTTDDRVGLVIQPELARLGVFINGAGGSVLTDDETSNMSSPESIEGLEFIEQMFADGWAEVPANLDSGWSGEAFGQERAAMTIEGNWIIGAMNAEFPDIEYATAPLPEGPGGNPSYVFTVCYGVAADGGNVEQATDLAAYLTSADQLIEYTRDFPVIPSRESVREEWIEANPGTEAYLEGADDAIGWQFPAGFQPALDEINSVLQGVADGSVDAQTAADRMDAAISDILG
jgi:multiple sugar transport system substrate-binding protein